MKSKITSETENYQYKLIYTLSELWYTSRVDLNIMRVWNIYLNQ